jgi:hypothetical protein
MGDEVQRIVPLRVGDRRVRAVCNQQLNDVEIPAPRRPLHWRGHQVAAEGINLCAGLEENAARSDLCVDGGPVERGDVLGVTVCGKGLSRLKECSDSGDVPALGRDEDACLQNT